MNSRTFHIVVPCLLCLLASIYPASLQAQSPAVVSQNEVYGIFNNPTTRETRIIAIGTNPGVPDADSSLFINAGPLPAPAAGENWFGSATLAYDRGRQRFLYAGRMGAQASVWSMDKRGVHQRITHAAKELQDHCITKMATGPDGNVYALTTPMRRSLASGNGKTLLVRIRPSSGPGKLRMETIGWLSGIGGYRSELAYSGDMAFTANGDLYIFGTEIDTVLQYYKGAHIFRVAGVTLKKYTGKSAIPVENLGRITGMGRKTGLDSTVINGVAFTNDGSFIISTVDKASATHTRFYTGKILHGQTIVQPLQLNHDMPPGFVIGDLASGSFPRITPPRPLTQAIAQNRTPISTDDWEKSVTITTFNY
jgi:hypothetical protein